MSSIKDTILDNHKTMDLYINAIAKVHGSNHPEVHDVKEIYANMYNKVENDDTNLDAEFEELRKVTNNYEIPSDACETYTAVYQNLEKLDKEYK